MTRSRWFPCSSIEFPLTAPAGEFSFHVFGKVLRVDIGRIKPFDNRNLFSVTAFVHFDIDPLLFFCYLLTDANSFGSPHVGQIPPIITCVFKFLFIYYLALPKEIRGIMPR